MLTKNTRDKYCKNRKKKKSMNKNQDLETEEAKKGPKREARSGTMGKQSERAVCPNDKLVKLKIHISF